MAQTRSQTRSQVQQTVPKKKPVEKPKLIGKRPKVLTTGLTTRTRTSKTDETKSDENMRNKQQTKTQNKINSNAAVAFYDGAHAPVNARNVPSHEVRRSDLHDDQVRILREEVKGLRHDLESGLVRRNMEPKKLGKWLYMRSLARLGVLFGIGYLSAHAIHTLIQSGISGKEALQTLTVAADHASRFMASATLKDPAEFNRMMTRTQAANHQYVSSPLKFRTGHTSTLEF